MFIGPSKGISSAISSQILVETSGFDLDGHQDPPDFNLSNNPENRFSVLLFLTATANAFFCPIKTTSFFPLVIPV